MAKLPDFSRASRVASPLGRQACEGSVRVVHLAHLADAQQVFGAGKLCAGGEGGHLHLISWNSPRIFEENMWIWHGRSWLNML